MSKLGVQSQTTVALDYIIEGKFPIWKIILVKPSDFPRSAIQKYKDQVGGLVVVRPFTNSFIPSGGNGKLLSSLLSTAESDGMIYGKWADAQCDHLRGLVDYVEILNEPDPTDDVNLQWLNEFTVSAHLTLHQRGWKTVGLNWSVGNPDYPKWPLLLDAVKACDAIGLHQYLIPSGDEPDTIYRHRKVHAILEGLGIHDKPLFIGEMGFDAQHDQQGFRSFMSNPTYISKLTTINAEYSKDDYLIGGAIFGCGMYANWRDFDLFPDREFFAVGALPGKVGTRMADVQLSVPVELKLTVNFEPGPRKVTRGLFIHDTTGPRDQQQDYQITVDYFDKPGTPASSHLIIGPTSTTREVHDDDIAWHAMENNYTHLGVELADDDAHTLPYTDYQYATCAEYAAKSAKLYGFPLTRVFSQSEPGLIGHQDSEQGKRWGKTDPGPNFNWSRFLMMAHEKSGEPPPSHPHPQFNFEIGEGFDQFLTDHPEYGLPRQNQWFDQWGNAFVWTTGTQQHPRGSLLVWRKFINQVEVLTW